MKQFHEVLATCVFLLAPLAAAAETGVRFDAVMMKDGAVVARPSVWTSFNQPVAVEVPNLIRFVAEAKTPVQGKSLVKAQFYLSDRGQWRAGWAPEAEMTITATPSYEHSFEWDKRYRIVLMPRQAEGPNAH